MKTVFAASKSSYGIQFFGVYDSLQEIKEAIVDHTHMFTEENPSYTEELFKKCVESEGFDIYKINLHDDEKIVFSDYDGYSDFSIEKIEKNILSTIESIE